MNPKEISRRANKIFETKIPDSCVIREQDDQEDYGIDYELELMTPNDKATGCIFKIQQKGQEEAKYSDDGKYLIYSGFSLEKMTYYLKKVNIPVAFSVTDVATESVFWIMLQGNKDVNQAYISALSQNQKTMTIKVPTTNCLPDTFGKLIESVNDANNALIIKGIENISSADLLVAALKDANRDFDLLAKKIALNNDFVRAEQIEQHIRKGDFNTAYNTAEKILNSPSERINMRFSAALNIFRIQPRLLAANQEIEQEQKIMLKRKEVSGKLLEITRSKETGRGLKIYAIYLCRAARLHGLVMKDTGLFLSRRTQEHTGNSFTKAITDAAQNRVTFEVVKEINRIQKYIPSLVKTRDFHLLPMVWEQFIIDLVPFIARIRYEGFNDSAQQLVELFDQTADFVIEIAKKSGNWDDVVKCSTKTLYLNMSYDEKYDYSERIASVRKTIESIPDDRIRSNGLKVLEIIGEELQSHNPGSQTSEQTDEYYRSMAASLGIDLSNEEDKIAQVINIGISDRNPERVLKNCIHLFVEVYSTGIPAQMMGLNTAGSKMLSCTKFNYGIAGLSLDKTYQAMNEEYCSKCTSCIPHPHDWKWTNEWQEQNTVIHNL